jgi:thioesterase domain-containing protein
MTGTAEFLSKLRARGVRVWVEDGRLKCDAPPGILDGSLREQLASRKQELLALISAARTTISAPRSLVPLKISGEYPPLFARPGHNGDVFCYRALAQHLDERRPLYGVEPKGLDGSPAEETVEEMAAYEVAQIRELQPRGPYYIAGFCAGGSIAFESARQLAAAGEEVARLMLFGSPFPAAYRVSQLRSVGHWFRQHAAALTAGSLGEAAQYVHGRLRARAEASMRKDPALENRRRVGDATVAAVKRYEPGYYAGRVDVFLPNGAWRRSGDQPDEWKRVSGRVVEHVGPDDANGDTMLLEPHIRVLAKLVNASMREEGVRHAAN